MNIYHTQIYFLATTRICSLSTSNEYTSCARYNARACFDHFYDVYVIAQYSTTVFSLTLKKGHKPETFLFFENIWLFDISLRSITLSATAIKVYRVRPRLHGSGQIFERTRDPRNRASFWVLQSITVFTRFRVNELHRSKICPDPRDLSGLRIWSTNSL